MGDEPLSEEMGRAAEEGVARTVTPTMRTLATEEIGKAYSGRHVVRGVSMQIAQGEVVVVNDKFGIRLTDVITPSERIRKLNR